MACRIYEAQVVSRLVIVSNRVPVPGQKGVISGGLAVVLNEALKTESLWFGWSGRISEAPEEAPHVVHKGPVAFATLDLTRQEHQLYYNGFANSCMFPLLLYRTDLMVYRREDHRGYLDVNERFASVLIKLLRPDDMIWAHDNHLLPVARLLREKGAKHPMGFFLHIPFPPHAVFDVLPCAKEILADLLVYDVLGFQTELDRENFVGAALKLDGAKPLPNGGVSYKGHECKIIVVPVGIDAPVFARVAERAVKSAATLRLQGSLVSRKLIIGAERLDYSKGLALRFTAFSRFLERWPHHRQKVSYLQIAARSREDVAEYRLLKRELDRHVGDVNGRFAEFDWVPIRYITRSQPRSRLAGFFRSAAIGLVTPLRDGLNLVCEEYVAAQDHNDPGVLVLSKYAGAADTLDGALIVNPYDPEEIAEALYKALAMPLEERQTRWTNMMTVIKTNSASSWCKRFTAQLADARRE
jgi:trehalose 6-phosphate synthase